MMYTARVGTLDCHYNVYDVQSEGRDTELSLYDVQHVHSEVLITENIYYGMSCPWDELPYLWDQLSMGSGILFILHLVLSCLRGLDELRFL
ncbi:hypothetical protein ACF0H5_014583 [Mactra antiquata]